MIEPLFRVIVEGETSGTTQTLSKAPIGTAYEKVYRNNMNDKSYSKSVYDGIQRILKEPSSTLWAQDTYVFSSQEYIDCKVFFEEFSSHEKSMINLIFSDRRSLEKVLWYHVICDDKRFALSQIHRKGNN